jgi:ankyrin repeat protein
MSLPFNHLSYSSLSKYIIQKTGVSNPKRIIDGWTPLHSASLRGHIEVAQHIIENLQDINPKRNDGWTPLHCAAQNGHVSLCQIIIPNVEVCINIHILL